MQLGDVLDHFADIDELDLADVEPMTQPYPLTNVLRDDVVQPCLDRDEVLAAAPDPVDGRFRVPPIIGLADDSPALLLRTDDRCCRAGGAGRTAAAAVLDAHLAEIERREDEIHAFNTVLRDEARAAAEAVDAAVAAGRDPGPLAGVPVALKDNMVDPRHPDDLLVADPRRVAAALRRHGRRAAAGRPGR